MVPNTTELRAKVLLIDDELAHRMLARRVLAKIMPANPIVEADCKERAVELLADPGLTLRIVILDLNLGKSSGLELLQLIRSSKSHQIVPVIVHSTSALDADVHSSYRLGANCFIIKSPEPARYQADLRAAVGFFITR